jgi:hypothetical protein
MLRLLQIDGKVDKEKASSSSHYLRPRAKESASHGNSFAFFYYISLQSGRVDYVKKTSLSRMWENGLDVLIKYFNGQLPWRRCQLVFFRGYSALSHFGKE